MVATTVHVFVVQLSRVFLCRPLLPGGTRNERTPAGLSVSARDTPSAGRVTLLNICPCNALFATKWQIIDFDVGLIKPDWLAGATYLGEEKSGIYE